MNTFTFQEDIINLIKQNHEKINIKFNEIDLNTFEKLNINEAESLISLIKKLEINTDNIINNLNEMQNLKLNSYKNQLIDKELNLKITPIILIYRTLLNEKYKHLSETSIYDLE